MSAAAIQRAESAGRDWFASTHWSVVLAAKEGEPQIASPALEQLARVYWPPLYAFIRREGYSDAEAKDLTQDFFLRFIERDVLKRLRHQEGKFRSFLLTFLKHFLQEQRGRAKAQKRGGHIVFIPLEELEGAAYLEEPVDKLSPDQVFERRWAQALFQQALNRLRHEYEDSGKAQLFDVLKDVHPRGAGAPTYAEIAVNNGTTEAAIKCAVQRMRQRHREILREEICRTVGRLDDVDDEIRYLREILTRAAH